MKTLLELSWAAMAMSSAAVAAVGVGLWLRDVLRKQDTDEVDPNPFTKRGAIYMLLTGCVFVGIRLARGEPLSFIEVGFIAGYVGFALAAGWYLLARRGTEGPSQRKVDGFSTAIAVSFSAVCVNLLKWSRAARNAALTAPPAEAVLDGHSLSRGLLRPVEDCSGASLGSQRASCPSPPTKTANSMAARAISTIARRNLGVIS
jgi:hypothetical protein